MSTPYVAYTYADGSANTLRPTRITYPNGREVDYDYGVADSPDDLFSRIFQIKEDADDLAQYDYLGASKIIKADYREPATSYDLTYQGTLGNPLAGCLDALGRVIQGPWLKDGSPIAGATYQFDRVANRTQMQPLGYAATDDRQRYLYGSLDRLTSLARGTTDAPQGAERWNLDSTGNWKEYDVLAADDPTKNLSQRRTANEANELTIVDNFYGAAWAQPMYDATGNMTTLPQPSTPADGYTATYDAWNRMTRLQDGMSLVDEYSYDAKTRRVTQIASGSTRHVYFSLRWQCLEERLDAATTAERQFVWGNRYVDDLILRDIGADRYYDLQDGNWNTVAVVDDAGDVQQRFRYSAYGEPTRLNADGTPATDPDTILWETLYAGYRYDRITELYCVRYRYLNSTVGKWSTRDPIGYESETNLYGYARSNPLSQVDPLGTVSFLTVGTFTIRLENGVDSQGVKVNLWRSSATIKWHAPESCPCKQVTLYQIADTLEEFKNRIFWGTNVNSFPWKYDPIERPHPKGARSTRWIDSLPDNQISGPNDEGTSIGQSGTGATVIDAPGLDDESRNIRLVQQFETCAICSDRKEQSFGRILGCVNWKIVVYRDQHGAINKIGHIGGGVNRVGEMQGGARVESLDPTPGVAPSSVFSEIIQRVLFPPRQLGHGPRRSQ